MYRLIAVNIGVVTDSQIVTYADTPVNADIPRRGKIPAKVNIADHASAVHVHRTANARIPTHCHVFDVGTHRADADPTFAMAQRVLDDVQTAVGAIPYPRDTVADLLHTGILAAVAYIVAVRAYVQTVDTGVQVASIIANTIYLGL